MSDEQEYRKLAKNHKAKCLRAAASFSNLILELVDNLGDETIESVDDLLCTLSVITNSPDETLQPEDLQSLWTELEFHLDQKLPDSETSLADALAEFGVSFPPFPEFGNSTNQGVTKNRRNFFKLVIVETPDESQL